MSKSERTQKPDTKIVTAGRRKEWTGPIVNTPVHRASTILYDDVASLRAGPSKNVDGQFFYGRRGTPTQWSLAEALTEMEPGAAGTMLYSSGVAALTSALLAILKPGDHLLMTDNAYDPTRSFCDGFLKDWGVETTYYDPPIGAGIDALLRPNTAAIFMEVPGSLTFEVHDVPAIVAVAQAHGIATVVDNTWATSLFFKPLSHGVDLSIIAATKYIVGHSDAMAGAVTANANYYPALRRVSQQLGQQLGPDDAWLASRGLRTLSVRLHQHQDSALRIAQWLETQNEVAHVLHPALHSHPGHDLWKRDFEGASGLFSIVMRGGDDTAVAAMINDLDLFGIGYSWGGFESLALPVWPEKHRTASPWQAEGPVVRLQIGLEDADDLIADLRAGLDRFAAAVCG
jgi:cysteine-S-conjugate beta-lyase